MASTKSGRGISRRDFIKVAGSGGLLTGVLGPAFLFPERAAAQQKTLKILQWSHFVPAFDEWFNKKFAVEWGQKHNTNVIVDNINLVDLNVRAASEAQAQKGHDLFMFLSPPPAYENQVIDMTHVYQEVEKRWGKKLDLAHKSTYNPKTKKYYAFSDSYAPDPGNWRKDLWEKVDFPNGPDTYDDLRKGAKMIKDRFGNPCGLGLSQELDSSMALRALLWSFGGAEQDEEGYVTIYSRNTIEALKYMKSLYQESETPEVFTWTPPSNNQAMLAGKVSYVANSISITRQAEREKLPINSNINLMRALRGPVARLSPQHVMNCYVIWEFAANKEGAQQFLIDYIDNFHAGFIAGGYYNFPCFPKVVPNLKQELLKEIPLAQTNTHDSPGLGKYYKHASFSAGLVDGEIEIDQPATRRSRYAVLADAQEWVTNLGHPGYASYGIDAAFRRWVIPTMFATVAQGKSAPADAARTAEMEYVRILERPARPEIPPPSPTPTPG